MSHGDDETLVGASAASDAAATDAAVTDAALTDDRGRRDERREKQQRRRRRTALGALLAVVVVAAAGGIVWAAATPRPVIAMVDGEPEPTWAATASTPAPTPSETAPNPQPVETTTPAQPGTHPIAGDYATADSLTVLVNKLTPLDPVDYEPGDLVPLTSIGVPSMNDHALREAAALAVQQMFAAASAEGYALDMTSGYRSSVVQGELYDGYVTELGQDGADATSARPGFSEHQTGLAADISAPDEGCVLEQCFADTASGQWLAAHAWEYGFILRYPDGATDVTGYEFEPWHFRYVGVDVSTAMQEQGVATYEEFLGAPAAPGYAS